MATAAVAAGILVASVVASEIEKEKAASSAEGSQLASANLQEDQLDQRMDQVKISTTNEMINRDSQLQTLLSTQTAESASRGLSPQSASFGAIKGETFNNFARDRNATLLNQRFQIDSIEAQKNALDISKSAIKEAKNAKTTESIFGSIGSIAGIFVGGGALGSLAGGAAGGSAAPVSTASPVPGVGSAVSEGTPSQFGAGSESFDINDLVASGNRSFNEKALE